MDLVGQSRVLDASKKEGCPILTTCSSRESCDSSGATRTSCTSLEVVREKNELSLTERKSPRHYPKGGLRLNAVFVRILLLLSEVSSIQICPNKLVVRGRINLVDFFTSIRGFMKKDIKMIENQNLMLITVSYNTNFLNGSPLFCSPYLFIYLFIYFLYIYVFAQLFIYLLVEMRVTLASLVYSRLGSS